MKYNIIKAKISSPSIQSLPILPTVFFLRNGSLPIGLKILVAPLIAGITEISREII
jgi:hypothetical protein